MKQLTMRKVARGAGTIFVALIALDLVATAVTLAIGATWLRR